MQHPRTVFERMADAVRLRDIQQPFGFQVGSLLSRAEVISDYKKACGQPHGGPVLVVGLQDEYDQHHDLPYGVYFPHQDPLFWNPEYEIVRENSEGPQVDDNQAFFPLDPACFRSADTAYLSVLRDTKPEFPTPGLLILDGGAWTGIVTERYLFAPPAAMCLMALVLELERAALEMCRLFPKETFESLSNKRQNMAVRHAQRRFDSFKASQDVQTWNAAQAKYARYGMEGLEERVVAALVDCTCFSDKGKMIRKCQLTIDVEHKWCERVFNDAEKLRNTLAHTGFEREGTLMSYTKLRALVSDVESLTKTLQESFDRECRVRGIAPPQSS